MTKSMIDQGAAPAVPAKRPPNVVITTWRGDQDFDSGKVGAPPIHLDSHGKRGPGPIEALLGALAACAATDVVEILAKRRTPVESLEVESVGTRVDTTPRRLEHVLLKFKLAGVGIERVHAERAIELSVNKYCSVRDSLDPRITIEWSLELAGGA